MKKTFVFVSLLLAVGIASAQEKENYKIANLPYYSYKKGLGVTSPDSLYQVNIRFRMQNRLEANFDDDKATEYKGNVRRLRLRFDGYAIDPRWKYALQLSFTPEDVGKLEDQGALNVIRDAVIFYQATNKLSVGFGQTKLPGNRQRVNSSSALDLTDRTINNAMFNIDRDFGFQAVYSNQKENAFGYDVKAAISTGHGRNSIDKRTGLAYTGRLELYPLGKFKKNGAFFEGDLMREQTPKLYLGATYHHNQNAGKSQGQMGTALFEGRDLNSVLIDALLKYKGWAGSLSYMSRTTDNPLTFNPKYTVGSNLQELNFVRVGHGYDAQLSYNFPSNLEIIGRYSFNNPHKDIEKYLPQQEQITFGVTKYLWEHLFKIQLEVSKNNFKYFDGRKDDNWYARFQIEFGI